MRITATLSNKSSLDWLRTQHNDTLRRVAFATGGLVSGTKPILVSRLQQILRSCEYRPAGLPDPHDPTAAVSPREMRLLSIDMGVVNLAFSLFVVPPDHRWRVDGPDRPRPILTAWKKLSVVDIIHFKNDVKPPRRRQSLEAKAKRLDEFDNEITDSQKQDYLRIPVTTYAEHAYNLITALIDHYNPTHILIERQRLRTAGGPNVLEWVIKVGMFETMLHTVLHTLREERGLQYLVDSVDPARIAATVEQRNKPSSQRALKNDPKYGAALNRKKLRVDLVGRWIGTWAEREGLATSAKDKDEDEESVLVPVENNATDPDATYGHNPAPYFKLRVGDDPELRDFALGYLQQWQTNLRRRRRPENMDAAERRFDIATKLHRDEDIRKMDDLADCVVQGLVWLDWHMMRDKISRLGPKALQSDRIDLTISKTAKKLRI